MLRQQLRPNKVTHVFCSLFLFISSSACGTGTSYVIRHQIACVYSPALEQFGVIMPHTMRIPLAMASNIKLMQILFIVQFDL